MRLLVNILSANRWSVSIVTLEVISLQSSVLDADAVPGFLVEIMFSQLQPVYCDLLDSLMAQWKVLSLNFCWCICDYSLILCKIASFAVNGSFSGAIDVHGQFVNIAVYNLKAEMQAAVWSIPSTADSSPSDDNISSAPALELQTRIDSSSYGDVKRSAISFQWYSLV